MSRKVNPTYQDNLILNAGLTIPQPFDSTIIVVIISLSLVITSTVLLIINKYPPDNLVVFHRRADISPLLLAALLKGECEPPLALVPSYP